MKPEAQSRALWGWVQDGVFCLLLLPTVSGRPKGSGSQDSSAVLFCAAAQAVKRRLLPIQPCQGPAGSWRDSGVFLFSFQTEKA